MNFAADQLPAPSAVDYEDGTAFYLSSGWQEGGAFAVDAPDAEVDPRLYSLAYSDKPAAVLHVLRGHFQAYVGRSFDWTPPGESVARRVVHIEPPQIQWKNPAIGSARVSLLEVLAH